jgi:hypothetical protein
MRLHLCVSVFLIAVFQVNLHAQPVAVPENDPNWLLPLEEIDADPKIPTLKQVVGFAWAHEISSHVQIERYLHALAEAAPDRTKLVRYGSSYERRSLNYLVISSPANIKRLDEIRQNNLLLSDPQKISDQQAGTLVKDSPAIVWLAYNVHGNECSTADAALVTAYHMLADRSEQTRGWLKQLVVIIDPLQNPDGRERLVHNFSKHRGEFVESNPWGSEHTEPWPSGRGNHYWFDMNRDWFLQSQRETQAKVKAYLDWLPQIYVDAHEMGRNATYFFMPLRDPINPFTLAKQNEWLSRIGRHQAKWFDDYGFRYTTREMFDGFYPGYGSKWPSLRGGLAMLWEQAGTRGLVIDRDDETKLYYHNCVRHHYVSGLATVGLTAANRESLLRDYHDVQRRDIQLGNDGPVRHYFLLEENCPQRTMRLARLLIRNGIGVHRITEPMTVSVCDIREDVVKDRVIPAGSYHVPIAQPGGRLARVLLDRNVEMDEQFVKRQLRRNELYMPNEIYDVTAWSLPLAFGVECLASEQSLDVPGKPYEAQPSLRAFPDQQPKVAYLVPGTDGAVEALCGWLQSGVRVHVMDRAMKLDGKEFAPGTLILFVHGNSDKLHETIREAATRLGLAVYAANTGFVDEGAHLGGPYVKWIRPPKIVIPVDQPTSYRVGHTWHLFDQRLHYPTTRVAARNLSHIDLDDFNVLVLPDGSYSDKYGFDERLAGRIRQWVSEGGTLLLIRGAVKWAIGDTISLLPTTQLQKPIEATETSGTKQQPDSEDEKPTMVSPDAAPGVFLRASVFTEHWLSYGYGDKIDVFYTGDLILKPLLPTKGRNIVTFATQDKLLTSGFCWPKTLELLAQTPYVTHQRQGSGHIVAFTDDPNYRAMYPSVQRLFINAVLFGPGH